MSHMPTPPIGLRVAFLGILTACAALIGFAMTLEGGLPVAEIPHGAVLVHEEYAACNKAAVIEYYYRSYGYPGDKVGFLHTFGPYAIDKYNEYFGPAVFWIYYPQDGLHHTIWESTTRLVVLPGSRATIPYSIEKLIADYPRGICTVLRQMEYSNEGGRAKYDGEVRSLLTE